MTTAEETIRSGLAHQQAGQLQQAEQLYRQVLSAEPRHAQALYLLGLLAYQVGKQDLAAQYVTAAIRSDGGRAEYHGTLAEVYRALGQLQPAIVSYRQALRINANYPEAYSNLGTLLQQQGDHEQAADCYCAAIRLHPQYAEAHHNLATLRQLQGNHAGAAEHYRETLRLRPANGPAQLGLGCALHFLGQTSEATSWLEAAVQAMPGSHQAHGLLATVYQAQGRLDDAIAQYVYAIELDPTQPEAHFNLGTALREQRRFGDAVREFREALRHNPSFVTAHVGLAHIFNLLSRPDEAVLASREALELDPACAAAYAHLASALQRQGEMAEAVASYRRAVELKPDDAAEHSNLIYSLNFDPRYDAAAVLADHLAWAARHAEPLTAAASPHHNDRTPGRRLRIGYVSPHFRHQAVSFFSEPLIAAHDHARFEVFCYSHGAHRDAMTERFRQAADQWRDVVDLSDEAVAERIRADQIDILVDLAGHIGGNRLRVFARKPAPIQVTYLGYQNTTGMTAMDYRLTDAHADPPGITDPFHTETLVRLPGSFFCYLPADPAPEVNELPALATGQITFASLNHLQKITPLALETWARLLVAVPNSRLLILAYTPGHFEQMARDIMARAGIEPARVEVLNKRPRHEYLELHQQIDIALDSFPFNGHTTVCDALWMGVPSVMLEGNTYASRFGGSTLLNVGLGELIARSTDEYLDIAVAWARDLERLARWRRELRARMQQSPLLDHVGFTRNVEAAYELMWQKWCGRS